MIQHISRFMAKTTLYHGIGATAVVGTEAVKLGLTKVMLVAGPRVRKAGLLEGVEKSLSESKVSFEVFSDVKGDADVQTVHEIAVRVRESHCNGVVVVGGEAPCVRLKVLRSKRPTMSRVSANWKGSTNTRFLPYRSSAFLPRPVLALMYLGGSR